MLHSLFGPCRERLVRQVHRIHREVEVAFLVRQVHRIHQEVEVAFLVRQVHRIHQ